MSLRSDETLEAFVNRIIRNEEIMNILGLPCIYDDDNEELIDEKRKVLIDKFVTKTSQIPASLDKNNFETIKIGKKKYSNYGKKRITISFAQSIKINHDLLGRPQVDIYVYYDNTEMDGVYKLLDLISDEFSGQNLKVSLEDNSYFIKNIRNEGLSSQTSIINNYERIGIRFSYFSTVYKN